MKPQCEHLVSVLRDGRVHTAAEFWNAAHGQTIIAVSQRVGDINRIPDYHIGSTGRGRSASYWLICEPPVCDESGQYALAVAL